MISQNCKENHLEDNDNRSTNLCLNEIGKNAGLFTMTIGILFGVITAIIILIDYFTSKKDNNNNINYNITNTTNEKNSKYVYRPHRAAQGMMITFGLISLFCIPVIASIEVLYYKCKYPQFASQIYYKKSIINAFNSACECLCKLICG